MMNRRKRVWAGVLCLMSTAYLAQAEGLAIPLFDMRVAMGSQDSLELWIKKTPERGSVLLIEAEPAGARDFVPYSLRAMDDAFIDQDEVRVLDGRGIAGAEAGYSLFDSSPEVHAELGRAFHIRIPRTVRFGYPSGRNGTLDMVDGARFAVRCFALPKADYTGAYADNPVRLRLAEKIAAVPAPPVPPPVPTPLPTPDLADCERLRDEMRTLYSETALLVAQLRLGTGDSGLLYELLDSGKLGYDALFENLDVSIRNNIENGYIIDPRNLKDIVVYVSKIFRYNSTGGIKEGDRAYVFRGEDEPVGYISFAKSGERCVASLVELASDKVPIQPFDKIIFDLN